MRLREGLRVVRRTDSEVQVGLDPRWAVRIGGLAPHEVDALVAADSDIAGHGTLPATTPRLREIVGQLQQADLVAPTEPVPRRRGTGAPDRAVWNLMDGSGDARLRRRGSQSVGVLGLGPVGVSVALHLAGAGLGTVMVDDPRPVRSIDVGACGYRWEDIGCERQTVVARLLADIAPDVLMDGPAQPDLLVLVEHGAADPVRAALLLSSGVPHLSVLVRDADVVVGPLVVAGAGPCLHCLDLHHGDLDPAWATVADAIARPARDGLEPGLLAGAAGALAVAVALEHLDTGAHLAATYEIALPDALPRRRDWAAHPSCGCAAQLL